MKAAILDRCFATWGREEERASGLFREWHQGPVPARRFLSPGEKISFQQGGEKRESAAT